MIAVQITNAILFGAIGGIVAGVVGVFITELHHRRQK